DDAEGTSCLANAEIFDGLAKMGYEKLSEKLTFYKAFFSPQWNFLIHTILWCLSAKTTSWNEFSSTIASTIIFLATNQKFNISRYILLSLVKNIEDGVPFFMFPRGWVVTKLFDNMLVPAAEEVGLIQANVQSITIPSEPSTSKPHKKHKSKKQQPHAPKVPSHEPSPKHMLPSPSNDPFPGGKDSKKLKEFIDLCTHLSNKVLELESEVIDIKSSSKERIKKLEDRVAKLEKENRVLKELHSVDSKADTVASVVEKEKSFKQGRIIAEIDEYVKINLEEAQAKLYKIDLEHLEKKYTAGATTIAEALKVSVPRKQRGVIIQDPKETTLNVVMHSKVQSKDKGKDILIEEPKPLKGKAQIEQDEAFARQLEVELNANINWNDVMDQVKKSERLNDAVMKYQALKRKPLTEAQERKNMIIYLKNMSGFKMNYFKGMTCSEIRPLFENHFNYNQAFLEEVNEEVTLPEKEVEVEAHKKEGESLENEVTKKQKMDEEAKDLKIHLQIVANDDDVYIEATPLASKIPIVNYKIHFERNKPYFKIIRADGNHMSFLSFNTMLKNFYREDLESLWKLVKQRFEKTEPKNYSDDYLLKTLRIMFEQPDVEACIRRDQKGRYVSSREDAKLGNGQEDESAPSDYQFFSGNEEIDTAYETEYGV
nr:hypothetical protein [Tanacetum cinerariifolium]